MNIFIKRFLRALQLDINLYEEVEADPSSLLSAMSIVIISSIAAGIGTIQQQNPAGIVWGTVIALLSWFIWSFLTYFIGTRILPEPQTEADYGQLLRTIGFSSAPGVIRVFGSIPVLGIITNVIASIWMLAAMIVAVRQALDYSSTWRAVAVCAIGWIVQLIAIVALSLLY